MISKETFLSTIEDMTCNNHSYISYEDIQKIGAYIHSNQITIAELSNYIKIAFGPYHHYLKPRYKYLIYLLLTGRKLTISPIEKEWMIDDFDTYEYEHDDAEVLVYDIAKKLGIFHFHF